MMRNKTIIKLALIITASIYILLIWYYLRANNYSVDITFSTFLANIFVPLSAISTVVVSFYIYKMSSREKRADNDFKIILQTYYRIVDTYELLKQTKEKECNSAIIENIERKIKVDSILMLNMLRRYPTNKTDLLKIEGNLYGISLHPDRDFEYDELATNIQNFFYDIDPHIIKTKDGYTFKIK